jgi:nicotinamide-nucleotide amidase
MSETNLKQAMIPRGATPIANPWGTAPGIRAELGGAVVYAVPGVPREMKEMCTHCVFPELQARSSGQHVAMRVLRTFGAGESVVGEQIADLMEPGRNPTVGTEATEGVISVRIIGRADQDDAARQLVDADAEQMRSRLGELIFGEDDDTLEGVVGRELAARGATVATAESCTGGLIAKTLTDVSGSSQYFVRGYVTYSNESKTELLGVPAEVIEAEGAVSEAVAEAMAIGCRRSAGSNYALSITGIAGPTGGTPDKPVGLVYVGLADEGGCTVRRMLFGQHSNRHAVRDRTCKAALNLLRHRLQSP